LPKPSAPKGSFQTMLGVTLVVCEVLPGGSRATYLCLLEIKQNNSK